jgi:hypothetical protein
MAKRKNDAGAAAATSATVGYERQIWGGQEGENRSSRTERSPRMLDA